MDFGDTPTVWLPKGAKIIKADEQNNSIRDSRMLYLWAVIDDEEKENEERKFRIAGTGHPLGENLHLKPISCIFTEGDTLIWHLFEILS
jgi:hypothetical protein